MRKGPIVRAAAAAVFSMGAVGSAQGAVNVWNGTGGPNWSNASWSIAGGPGTGDTASFTDADSVSFPDTVTSILDANRTIGGLAFSNNSGRYHTLDLNAFTLNVNGGLNFNTDINGATITSIRNGALTVNGPFSDINVGRGIAGVGMSNADLSGLTSLSGTLRTLNLGTSTGIAGGGANGTLTLSPSNNLTLKAMEVGVSGSGTLHLGASNTLVTPLLEISKEAAQGTVDIVNGGTLTLGSPTTRTQVLLGSVTGVTPNVYTGQLTLTGGTFNGFLSSLVVAQSSGPSGAGGSQGIILGGSGGTLDIGGAGNTGNIHIGRALVATSANGNVDFGGMASLSANVNTLSVGVSSGSGAATGLLKLPLANTIDALSVVVGSNGAGTLTLGKNTNTVTANEMIIGQNAGNGTATLPAGGTLNLGSAARPTALSVGVSVANTNSVYTGKLDLSGGTFNAFLSGLTVGQRDAGGGSGTTFGLLTGATGGSVTIGSAAYPGNVYVGRSLGGGGPATGTVDFGALATLNANLDTLSVGTSQSGGVQGTLKLAKANVISAANILIGKDVLDNDRPAMALVLGNTNTILANKITIGQDYSIGAVTIPANGTLTLGSAEAPVNLSIAVAFTGTNRTYGGSLDLTAATATAYLGNVIIGQKNVAPGSEVGTLTFSDKPGNFISAGSITLGGNQSTGTLNYGGGVFYADSIAKSTGTANFNWTGGTLSPASFGTPAMPFNLSNTGTGTLAAGSASGAIGTTNIYGTYTQGPAAATAIRIAGSSPVNGNDLVNISGAATLGGSLNLRLTNNFVPSVGENYLIETYASRSGQYAFVRPPSLPQNVAFLLDSSSPTQLFVRMVTPTAQNYTSTAATGSFGTASSYTPSGSPTTTSAVTISNTTAAAKDVSVNASTTVHSIALSGPGGPLTFQVPQGIQLGVSNQITVGAGATLSGGGQIFGNIVASGGTVYPGGGGSPGAALTIDGNFRQTSPGHLRVEIASPPAGGGANRLNISGSATLGGTLDLNRLASYSPTLGDTFGIVTAASRSGTFDVVSGVNSAGQGLSFAVTYAPAAVNVTTALPGDINLDGVVGPGDFNLLATNFGTAGRTWSAGDLDGDGVVGPSDFNLLASNFGRSGPIGQLSVSRADLQALESFGVAISVPEPGCATLAGLLVAALTCGPRRRRAR